MKPRLTLLLLAVLSVVATLSAQGPKLTFEVTSVKKQAGVVPRSPPAGPLPGASSIYRARNATVATLIVFAYGIINDQLLGGPEWARADLFEIDARAGREASRDEMRLMVRSLLEDRFKLVIHGEQRNLRASAVVLAAKDGRLGPKLQQCTDPDRPTERRPVPVPKGGLVESLRCVSISAIAKMAAGILRGPVVDQTGLTGLWTFELLYAPEIDGEAPPFQTALQDQLGLKIESKIQPVEVMVIDSVQQPTAN